MRPYLQKWGGYVSLQVGNLRLDILLELTTCRTCSLDDSCVLCSKCFDASDHAGHVVLVLISPGNSGCCDCGDAEAWRLPVKCAIHTASDDDTTPMDADGGSLALPPDLVEAIRSTIARAFDYLCDVISCSPEQLRLQKSVTDIRHDEKQSRLTSRYYGSEVEAECMEYALTLWNDEKHTIPEVQEQVRRACKETLEFGKLRAHEANSMGRSIVKYSTDLRDLMQVSRIVEQIKVTVTIRSSRDTFREQMCGTIIEWLEDISGCSVGEDHDIFRRTICEELLAVWRVGSKAFNTEIGRQGIDDHASEEERENVVATLRFMVPVDLIGAAVVGEAEDMDVDPEMEAPDLDGRDEDEDDEDDRDHVEMDEDDVDMVGSGTGNSEDGDGLADRSFTVQRLLQEDVPRLTDPAHPQARDPALPEDSIARAPRIPQTPHLPAGLRPSRPAVSYWVEKPADYYRPSLPPYEDLRQRVRLDWLIMFDLRLWKRARIDLRDLYIGTVVAIPEFKRILGLRFAGLYTPLSQLYLIADREPDHSIINLSLQMLTTPSITAEVVQRGNFLTTLMAILYTFLTTRQVGHPNQVNPEATLAFDGGTVTNPLTNRRMYHFFHDMRYLLVSPYVQERLRDEPRYTLQFLDLVRLHQGICPNVRAVTEHVEYEAEAWISASFITREINKLVRQFADAFRIGGVLSDGSLRRAISVAARYATVNSMGWERHRFKQAEIRTEVEFKEVTVPGLQHVGWNRPHSYSIVRFAVDMQPISFHHALHYTLSWLIEAGKAMSNEELRGLLLLTWDQVKDHAPPSAVDHGPEDLAVAMLDMPLRVCVWLAQMKAGIWVRNGFSLRHQMQTYRSVLHRDLTHNRDIFLLQTAMVTVDPSRILLGMVDRFNIYHWLNSSYRAPEGYDDTQVLDLVEDFLHLLIIILSDRLPLIPTEEEPNLQALKIRRELVHILCFKAMQFSDLTRHIPERLQDNEMFQEVLNDIATFRPPDGISDYGSYELKEEYLDEVDPFIVQFTKNQREEIETRQRVRHAKKLGQPESEAVFEVPLRPIKTGAFRNIAAFTQTAAFACILYTSLSYALDFSPLVPETRVETFLQLSLHLCQLAVHEDDTLDGEETNDSFIRHALSDWSPLNRSGGDIDYTGTIATVLCRLATVEDFKACWPKIKHILRGFKDKQPSAFSAVSEWAAVMGQDFDVQENNSKEAEVQRKKQLAKERQARIMEQMKLQQQTFMDQAGLDFDDENFSDSDSDHTLPTEENKLWKYPTGTCIYCQGEMNASALYGTLGFVTESNMLRQTDATNVDFVYEVARTPESLDRSANDIRPFGVASMNRHMHRKLAADGSEILVERQGLGRGFPPEHVRKGPVAVGCSHLMHFSCFEHYYDSTRRRHPYQIARNHPENLEKREFVCPLCKALGNAFLPIIWKGKEEVSISASQSNTSFMDWFRGLGSTVNQLKKAVDGEEATLGNDRAMLLQYCCSNVVVPISAFLAARSGSTYPISEMVDFRSLGEWRVPGSAAQASTVSLPSALPQRGPNQLEELQRSYRRLRDTFKDNGISSAFSEDGILSTISPDLTFTHCDSLVRTLGYSISAVEIAQRGIASEPGFSLIDRISLQNIIHLRILSETISSYLAIGALQTPESATTLLQFRRMGRDRMHGLFVGCHDPFNEAAMTVEPLLRQDTFLFLSECSLCLPVESLSEIRHFIRLCYLAEIVKATIVFGRNCELPEILRNWEASKRVADIEGRIGYTEYQLDLLQRFAKVVGGSLGSPGELTTMSSFVLAVFRQLIAAYAAPFLRKTVILLHTRFGILFPPSDFAAADEPEHTRLCNMLGLPNMDALLSAFLADDAEGYCQREIVSGWCKHLLRKQARPTISHPSIFELVGLPLHFDTLMEEAMRRGCPSTGDDITDPCVCLFCGEIFCGQALCCAKQVDSIETGSKRLGGCNRHVLKFVI
jgi:E3 ubiquitin-protein ligase UBR1